MSDIKLLNLDGSYPVLDAYHDTPNAASGIIRFINASDPNTLDATNRLQGDIVHRFKLVESKVNEIITAAISGSLVRSTGENSAYVLRDGSAGFTKPAPGVSPTDPNHLATKEYVDSLIERVNEGLTELASDEGDSSIPSLLVSGWTTHTWNSGSLQVVSLPVLLNGQSVSVDIDKVVGISLLERVNVAVATVGNPSPSPRWVIRQLTVGNQTFGVSDIWLENNTVKAAIPNTAFYSEGYGSSYAAIQSVSFRQLRAIVTVQS